MCMCLYRCRKSFPGEKGLGTVWEYFAPSCYGESGLGRPMRLVWRWVSECLATSLGHSLDIQRHVWECGGEAYGTAL